MSIIDGGPISYLTTDSLTDLTTGLGNTGDDKSIAAQWMGIELSAEQLITAYRFDWIAGKVVDIPAFDSVRAWRSWQAADDQIERLEAEERRLGVRAKVARALKLGRLYGGAVLILGAQTPAPEEPITVDRLGKGGLEYIHVATRFEVTPGPIDLDPTSPGYGEPSYYSMGGSDGRLRQLHPSRVIRFLGRDAMHVTVGYSDQWSDSVLLGVSDAVRHAGLSQQGIAHLMQEASVDVMRIPDFMANVGTSEYRQRFLARARLAKIAKSNTRTLFMDSAEEYEQKSVNFSQLPELLQQYLNIASAAADIPATRFLSQSPGGLNATGDSDTRNYYDRVSSNQELDLRPRLEKLDELLIRSALGARDEKVHSTFNPLWQLSEQERSTIRKQDAETAKSYVDSGLVPLPAMAAAVQNDLVEKSTYPGLEDALAKLGDVKVGLPLELFKGLVAAWQAGGAPLEVVFIRLDQAGLLPPEMDTFDKFQGAIDEEGAAARETALEEAEASANIVPAVEKLRLGVAPPVAGQPPQGRAANDRAALEDAKPRTLYVRRDLVNVEEVQAWATEQGLGPMIADPHVTILYSKMPVDWMAMGESWAHEKNGELTIAPGGPRVVEPLGDEGAIVLHISSTELQWRHRAMIELGASSDYPDYQPHVTITYDPPEGLDLEKVTPYRGKLVFGPEIFEEVKGNPYGLAAAE